MGLLGDIFTTPLGSGYGDYIAEKMAEDIEAKNFDKNCLPIITLDRCIQWAKQTANEYPQAVGFVIAVKENPDPRNENDKICVIVALIDDKLKPITLDGVKGISTIFHGGTIDEKMLDRLNGNTSAKFRFK